MFISMILRLMWRPSIVWWSFWYRGISQEDIGSLQFMSENEGEYDGVWNSREQPLECCRMCNVWKKRLHKDSRILRLQRCEANSNKDSFFQLSQWNLVQSVTVTQYSWTCHSNNEWEAAVVVTRRLDIYPMGLVMSRTVDSWPQSLSKSGFVDDIHPKQRNNSKVCSPAVG